MAIAAACVWEFRSGATASNANGGFFKTGASGSDFSQQNAAQYNLTNGAVTSGSAVYTHASAAADMVGNGMHIVSGTNATVGWYEIISVVVGVSITLDRSVATGTGSNVAANIGGAISLGSSDDAVFESIVAGNKVWVKAGTYTLGGAVTIAAAGGGSQPIIIEGYNAARGDKPVDSTRPLFDAGANVFTSGTNWEYTYIRFTGTGTSVLSLGASNKVGYAKITNTSTTTTRIGLNFPSAATNAIAYRSEFISYRGKAVAIASTSVADTIMNCYIHDSDIGYTTSSTTVATALLNNIFEGCVTAAIQFTGAKTGFVLIAGNTIYGAENKLGIGLSIATGGTNIRAINNIFYGLATGISHADSQTVSFSQSNDFNNNTTNVTNWTLGAGDITTNPTFSSVAQTTGTAATTSGSTITDGSKDFVAAGVTAGRDYLYIASGTGITAGYYGITNVATTVLTLDIAPGTSAVADKVYQVTTVHNFAVGSNMQAVGTPGAFPAALSTSYMDIGAVQRKERVSTDPGIANVRSGTNYTINDSALSGTAAIPTAANVRSGTATDATTGTLAVPAASNVRSGTAVDATTGTAAIPTAANVRSGTATDATTGTLAVPAVGDVRSGVAVDNTTGALVVPSLANTKTGVAGDGGTGTYDGSDRWTDPGEANVRLATAYKANSTTNNKTGLLDLPAEADVRLSTVYDNTTKTGLLDLPAEANVLTGVVYDNTTKTGTAVVVTLADITAAKNEILLAVDETLKLTEFIGLK